MEKPSTKEDGARKPSSTEADSAPTTEVNVNVDAKPTTTEADE